MAISTTSQLTPVLQRGMSAKSKGEDNRRARTELLSSFQSSSSKAGSKQIADLVQTSPGAAILFGLQVDVAVADSTTLLTLKIITSKLAVL